MNVVQLSMCRQLVVSIVVALIHGLLIGTAAAGAQTTDIPDLTKVDVPPTPGPRLPSSTTVSADRAPR